MGIHLHRIVARVWDIQLGAGTTCQLPAAKHLAGWRCVCRHIDPCVLGPGPAAAATHYRQREGRAATAAATAAAPAADAAGSNRDRQGLACGGSAKVVHGYGCEDICAGVADGQGANVGDCGRGGIVGAIWERRQGGHEHKAGMDR